MLLTGVSPDAGSATCVFRACLTVAINGTERIALRSYHIELTNSGKPS
jgi:hypothetical protein